MLDFQAEDGHKTVLGMIHLPPLPGTPYHEPGSFPRLLDEAVAAAGLLHGCGADGCLVQTVDRVYGAADSADPARTVAMGLVVRAIADAMGARFPVGVQLMRNAVSPSLAVARVAGGSFVRAGALVGATLTASGLIEADPLGVAEYRTRIDALDIKIIADVHSMHYSWLGGQKPPDQVAAAARQAGADAVALCHRDEYKVIEMIRATRRAAPGVPVILAGYTDHHNAARLLAVADGAFVGSCLKSADGGAGLDKDKVRRYLDVVRGLER
ncbi:BtpA/SgcQ family protein [Streptomyces sp. NPDC048506]|uniref:BtpA/SgcQ family protein n=1 Tax=Streptomyces sp. NPDC048506 TaxID=3155028 RepID=UPI003445CAF0